MIAGLVGGALWAAWRRGIGGEIQKLRGLLVTELANDEEHRERARRIIEQHQHMGYAGPLLNRDAFDTMCALCAADGAKAHAFPRFYASLARIRSKLRCVLFGASATSATGATSDAYV